MKDLVIAGDLAVDLAAVFDASPNPYVLITPELVIAGCNEAYLCITGSTRGVIIGQPLFGAFTGGDGEDAPQNIREVTQSIDRAINGRKPDHLAMVAFAVEREQPDGSRRYEDTLWSATHTPIFDREGRVMYVLQHTTDITELEQLRRSSANDTDGSTFPISTRPADLIVGGGVLQRALQVQIANRELEGERRRLMDLFTQAPGFIAVLSGPDHIFEMHNPAYAQLIGHRDIAGKPLRDALPELAGQGYFDVLDQVFASGEAHEGRNSAILLQRRPDALPEEVFLTFVYQPIRNETDDVIGIFVQGHDVTNEVRAAERQRLMIDELNHRVKNTLATVQSIAMQTARSHSDIRTFAQAFEARLMALSHTHDLLTRSHWEGAELRDILKHETEAYGHHRVTLTGPLVDLESSTALSLGMIFHELATNAAKYGALSVETGRVMIDWSVEAGDSPRLRLVWREVDGPSVENPSRRGFGARLIERNIRHDLNGSFQQTFAPDGLVAEMAVSLDKAGVHRGPA